MRITTLRKVSGREAWTNVQRRPADGRIVQTVGIPYGPDISRLGLTDDEATALRDALSELLGP